MLASPNSNGGGNGHQLQQQQHNHHRHVTSDGGGDDEMLSLSLSECADDGDNSTAVEGATAVGHEEAAARAHEAARQHGHFESSMESFAAANGLSTTADNGHHGDLTPLAMPSSPSLLQLAGSPTAAALHALQHHHHHHNHVQQHPQHTQQHHMHQMTPQHHHSQQAHSHVSSTHAQLFHHQQQQHHHYAHQTNQHHLHAHHQQQQHPQQHQQQQQQQTRQNHAHGTLGMALLGSSSNNSSGNALTDAGTSAAAVQSYFTHETDSALAASVSSFSREFSELHKSVVGLDERRFADALADKLPSDTPLPLPSPPKTASKKRKGGANVSIDLQTKIRLIELAEEYQYDPKAAVRVKGESATHGLNANGKETISGIRLAAQFNLNKSTVSRILKRKDEYKKAYYKDNISGCSKHINKKSKFEKLNRLVENWFDMTREKKAAVSDTLIRDVGRRFADELGIDDFRASNGWVRSLRNRKESQSRHLSAEALAQARIKKDAEAIERMRVVFPNGLQDLSSFFKDLSTFLEKDCGVTGHSSVAVGSHSMLDSSHVSGMLTPTTVFSDLVDEALKDDDRSTTDDDSALRKKMVESLRAWSHELVEAELSRLKKRLKPRQVANL